MTRNQLQYHANKEIARANRAQEAETHRSNVANEDERFRSNTAQEGLKERELTEAERRNLAVEEETNRHNKHTEISNYIGSVGSAMRGAGSLLSSVTDSIPFIRPVSKIINPKY